MKKSIFLISGFSLLLLTGLGCLQIGPSALRSADGGIFKSLDKGKNWEQANLVITAKGSGTISGVNVSDLIFDPQDEKAIYLSSAGNGLFYTWNGAQSWTFVENLGAGYINSLAVDFRNKCVLYAALQNKIWKSGDCARSWENRYYDTRLDAYVSFIAADPLESNILYAGLSKGELMRSTDAGGSWSVIRRFNNKIQKIFIHPKNPKIIFVGLENDGLWRSKNKGEKWEDLREKMKDFPGSNQIYDLDTDKDGEIIYLTTNFGIIFSENLGDIWKKIDLLTPPGAIRIFAFAVNPNNKKEIYYSTATTFYSSFDGGKNWKTVKLPTGRAGTALLVHPKNNNIIYLGTRMFK